VSVDESEWQSEQCGEENGSGFIYLLPLKGLGGTDKSRQRFERGTSLKSRGQLAQ